MKRLISKRLIWTLAIIVLPFAIWAAVESVTITIGSGVTDSVMEFVFKDADTDRPLHDALLIIKGDDPPDNCEKCGEGLCSITADENGKIKLHMRCGTVSHSDLFSSSWHLHPPYWDIQGQAPGYSSTEWILLYDAVQETSPAPSVDGIVHVVIAIRLHKKSQ